ncbi:MAG: TSUP family transporter, partial [Akkermansiaceae bacterium]
MRILLIGLGIGLAAGLVGALCGVGGGILMVPAFVLALGMAQKSAVATSLAIVVLGALVAAAACMKVGADASAWAIMPLPASFAGRSTT